MADASSSIKGLLESGKYADLIIRCSGEIFKVHCAIVCTRSPFLAKAVDGQFKEAALRDIDLSADDVSVIRAMIRYLYTDDYDDGDPNPAATKHAESIDEDSFSFSQNQHFDMDPTLPVERDEAFPLMFNVKMYIVGDKYDIPGLRALATKKYQTCVAVHWNNATFSAAAQHLWDNTMETDRQLRDTIVSAAHINLDQLLDRGEFGDLMKSNGYFCFDVVKSLRGRSLEVVFEMPKFAKGEKKKAKVSKYFSRSDL